MDQKELSDLTNEQLLQEQKKAKSNKTLHAFLIGIFIGIAVYSAVKHGLGLPTLFPLVFVYLLIKNEKKSKALGDEMKSRNLE